MYKASENPFIARNSLGNENKVIEFNQKLLELNCKIKITKDKLKNSNLLRIIVLIVNTKSQLQICDQSNHKTNQIVQFMNKLIDIPRFFCYMR